MADYSLVPVEHQPDFENVALVPVDHDPFSADGVTQQVQNPKAQAQTAGATDFFRSVPRGVVSGFNSAASALGRATQAEMGQDVDAPTPQQGMQILEKEVTGPMYRPEGRAGQFGASVGEFLGNPASYMAPGSVPLKVGAAVLGGLGSEAGGQLGEGTPWEGPLRFAGGVLGPLGAGRLGTRARPAQTLVRAAEEASAGLGQAAENAPRTFYRGDRAGLTEFRSHAAQAGGQANSEAVLAKGDQHDLMTKHSLDSRNPPSPYIAVTTDPNVAQSHGDTSYRLQLAPGRAIPNPFSQYGESEHLVPHYISPDEIKGTLP
jgi:hypothetical protein